MSNEQAAITARLINTADFRRAWLNNIGTREMTDAEQDTFAEFNAVIKELCEALEPYAQ